MKDDERRTRYSFDLDASNSTSFSLNLTQTLQQPLRLFAIRAAPLCLVPSFVGHLPG